MQLDYSHHHGLPLNNGQLMFDEDELLFGYGSMPGPGLASNGSVSSAASSYASSFGPHTPLSGTSTPSRNGSFDFNTSRNGSMDSNASFDTNTFDLSPPASTNSSYFPTNIKNEDGSDMCQSAFPLTPSRHPINSWESQMSPSSSMDYYYPESLSQHTLVSTPPGLVLVGQTWESQWGPKWVHGDSPINFENKITPTGLSVSIHGLKIEGSDQHEFEAKRIRMEEAKLRATDLMHQMQQDQRPAVMRSVRMRPVKQQRSRRPTQESDIGTITQSVHHCDYPGCTDGPYRRNEHLKRHQKSKHGDDRYPCEYCDKVVNRKDNWRSHLLLHTQQRGKNGRVKFNPNSIKTFEEERAKISKRATTDAAKVKKRTSTAF
ncbi:hypothetical protein QBC38DRAFT_229865 [Podospora fimiseda]|uniref:C2H2-type domain-containing protein n=1 Tax=Podospora fimiseda TaxID=252190 RepID=A0AAN7H2V4_9PEZI|nr:hypothetical protein QBC38DRAFT_229865 [Podospora fimiseda]